MGKLYRYQDPYYEDVDNIEELEAEEYVIYKTTPKGYWIRIYEKGKWVPKKGINIFAWEREKDALFNYFMRKKYQVEVLKNQLKFAELFLEKAELLMQGNGEILD